MPALLGILVPEEKHTALSKWTVNNNIQTPSRGCSLPQTCEEQSKKKKEILISNNTKQNEQFYHTHHSAITPLETPRQDADWISHLWLILQIHAKHFWSRVLLWLWIVCFRTACLCRWKNIKSRLGFETHKLLSKGVFRLNAMQSLGSTNAHKVKCKWVLRDANPCVLSIYDTASRRRDQRDERTQLRNYWEFLESFEIGIHCKPKITETYQDRKPHAQLLFPLTYTDFLREVGELHKVSSQSALKPSELNCKIILTRSWRCFLRGPGLLWVVWRYEIRGSSLGRHFQPVLFY